MTTNLANSGLQCEGFPWNVPFPNPVDKGKRSKGLQDIGGPAMKTMVDAIFDRNNPNPLRITRYGGSKRGKAVAL